MTQDEIIRMAQDAGLGIELAVSGSLPLERFASLVAEATKEKAAKVCEEFTADMRHQSKEAYSFALNCAVAIRSIK